MYEHKILCFLEYEEDDDEDDDEEDDEEKWKNGYFIQKIVKKLQPHPTEDDGEIYADISDEKWWYCLFIQLKNNKIILFCTHTVRYFIYKHHMVGLVLKVNPQLHCCYQTQSIKHTHRKIS